MKDVCLAGMGEGEEELDAQECEERDEPLEDPEEEGIAKARLAQPGAPAKADYDRHMLTHMPSHAWCLWCVTG